MFLKINYGALQIYQQFISIKNTYCTINKNIREHFHISLKILMSIITIYAGIYNYTLMIMLYLDMHVLS